MPTARHLIICLALAALFASVAAPLAMAADGPAAPANVHATQGVYEDKIVVSWDASPGATSYQVWRGLVGGQAGYLFLGEPVASPFADVSVLPGETYSYYVKACEGGLCGPSSAPATGWIAAGDAFEPDNTRATANAIASGETQEHTLTPSGDIDWIGFELGTTSGLTIDLQAYGIAATVSVYDSDGLLIQQASTDGMSAAFTTIIAWPCAQGGLAPGRYSLSVTGDVALTFDTYRIRTEMIDCSAPVPPAPPEGVVASDGDAPSSVFIRWEPSAGATQYMVYRAASPSGEFSRIGTTTTTSHADSSVIARELYYYAVVACNHEACSGRSDVDAGYASGLGGANDPYEPDDTIALAHPIASGAVQSRSLYPIGDVDWLTFELAATSQIELLAHHDDQVVSEIALYTSLGNLIETQTGVVHTQILRVCGDDPLPAGRYYVRIQETSGQETVERYDVLLAAYSCIAEEPVSVWCIPLVSANQQ